MIAHKRSSFDSYAVLNKLPQLRTVVSLTKNVSPIGFFKRFNGFVGQKNPQNVHCRCGIVHINNSLKKIGVVYKLQLSLLKQELNHVEFYGDTGEDKEHEWLPYPKNKVLSTAFFYAKPSKGMEELTVLA